MKVEICADIACPWCRLGTYQFHRAVAAAGAEPDVELVHRPYQLIPDAPEEPRPLMDTVVEMYGDRLSQRDPHRPPPGEPRAAHDPATTTLAERRQARAAALRALGLEEARYPSGLETSTLVTAASGISQACRTSL
jgi:predicted DsbA family dithiol-disulfide isomerase